jgi:uncharacterized phiE125 gp8 family phage protein
MRERGITLIARVYQKHRGYKMHAILTAPPLVEPVSLAEAKAHLRLTTDDEDEALTRRIVAARKLVERRSGLALIAQSWSAFADDWPSSGTFHLPLWPVIEVAALKVHGEEGEAQEIDPAHYFCDLVSRPARLVLRPWRVWAKPGRIANGVEIAFTAGFGASAGTVPGDLREAVLRMIAHWHEVRGDEASFDAPVIGALLQPWRELHL